MNTVRTHWYYTVDHKSVTASANRAQQLLHKNKQTKTELVLKIIISIELIEYEYTKLFTNSTLVQVKCADL